MAIRPGGSLAPAVVGRRRLAKAISVDVARRAPTGPWLFWPGPDLNAVTPTPFDHAQTGVTLTGAQFGATQGAGLVELGDSADYATANKQAQTVTAWSATSITITANLGSLGPGARWVFVTTDGGLTSEGRPVQVRRAAAFTDSLSANISAAGADTTTARLTAPAGKTTGDHDPGRRVDDGATTPGTTTTANDYTEHEFALEATAAAVSSSIYEFRLVRSDGTVLDAYTVTPQWTITGGGGTNYTKTPADAVGVTDARTVVATAARAVADPVGVTDTAARAVAATRTPADPVGITDARTVAAARSRVVGDTAGVTDTTARAAAIARSPADPVGVTDSVVAQLGQVVADTAGITDAVVATVAAARAVADPVGITDSAAGDAAPADVVLLDTFALASADPHSITITGATAGLDLWLLVNTPAVVTTPAGWTVEASRIDAMGSYVLHLPGESNPGGSVGVTLDISAARALAAVAFQAPADDASVYASLVAQVNGPGSTAWGTGAHTFAARDDAVAVFMFHEDLSGAPASFSASSYDHGFAAFADSGWAGAGSTGNEAVRVVVGSATAVGFAADGVTLTLTAAGPTGSAMGFVAFDLDTGLLAVKADPIGITDTVARTAATARTVADAAGVTDARTVAASAARTAADPVGITDSVSAVLGQLVADQVGVTDTVAVARTSARTVANPVGVTDSVSANLTGGSTNYTRTPADPVGVTDSAARAVAYVRTVADAVGVTDTGSPQTIDIGYTLADPAGVTDAAARAVAAVRARNDAVGIVDSASSSLSGGGGTNYTRTPADPVGITDARTVARTLPRSPADAVGVADAAVRVLARARTQADAVGLVDTVLVVRTTARTLANPVGITDTAYVPGAAPPWSWLVSTGAGLAEHTPLLDGVHPSTATIT